jgi:hypothetical protein
MFHCLSASGVADQFFRAVFRKIDLSIECKVAPQAYSAGHFNSLLLHSLYKIYADLLPTNPVVSRSFSEKNQRKL